MDKRILTIFAVAVAGLGGTRAVLAQGYSDPRYAEPPGLSYPSPPGSYAPPGRAVSPGRAALQEFDDLDDDDVPATPGAPGSTALSTPGPGPAPGGPVLSPDDPRYGRPAGAPPVVYSNRPPADEGYVNVAPEGPVMSPDDPRYGRPAGPPPVIYSNRPPPANYAPDTYAPGNYANAGPGGAPPTGDGPMRPPGAIDPQSAPTGAVQQRAPIGPNGQPMNLSALPVDEQPEMGPRKELPERLRRQEVSYVTKEPAGTIIVDTPNTQLYYILGNGRAIRYGVRVGRDGFTWTGVQKITRKAEWPDWHPPPEMIERQPYLPRFMAGGDGNPLGARAMYLGNTVYRIHGTNQPSTIGKFVSSGCIGMLNEDVTDLFDRVKVGTRVVVLPGGPPPGTATVSALPPGAGQVSMAPPAPMANGRAVANIPGTGPTVVPPLPAPVTIR
jgi:lipoprotein-anchoring transpeptidase ErfK/SrfK